MARPRSSMRAAKLVVAGLVVAGLVVDRTGKPSPKTSRTPADLVQRPMESGTATQATHGSGDHAE
jgi:hypothetical protein